MTAPSEIQIILSLAVSPGSTGYKMHNAGYKTLGLNYLYLPRKYEGKIENALKAIKTLGIKGISLTMPYKISALPYLDKLSDEAQQIGAVNTVVNKKNILAGYNTDALAAQKLIEQHLPGKDKPWVILGAGGMAHAFAYVAKQLKAKALICSRDQEKSEILANKFGLLTMPWGQWQQIKRMILCNATPLGMFSSNNEKVDIPDSIMKSLMGVFDAVANPADTELIRAAKQNSVPFVSGDMLAFEQACLQFKLYTGTDAPREIMHEAMYG